MASLLELHNLQAEVARRCGKAGISVRFDPECTVPHATPKGVVFPTMKGEVSAEEYDRLRAAAIHEPIHVTRPEMFAIMQREALPLEHPLAGLSNAFEDDVMERLHCREYPGDYLDLSRMVYGLCAKMIDRGKAPEPPTPEQAKFMASMLCFLNSRSRWDRIVATLLPEVEALQYPETMDWYGKLTAAGIPDHLQTITTSAEVRDAAKNAYNILYPDNDAEDEVRKAQEQQAKGKAGEGEEGEGKKAKGKAGDGDEEAEGEGILDEVTKVRWDQLAPSNHSEYLTENPEGEGFSIDYEGAPTGEWVMYPPTGITEEKATPSHSIVAADALADASLANQIRRAIQSRMRVTISPEKRSGKINPSALHRIAMPMRGDGDWNSRIFKKKSDVSEVNTAVTLLIDRSGSMRGKKIKLACTAAARFNHLFGTVLRVPTEILAFTCNGTSLHHTVVKDFNDRLAPEELNLRLGGLENYMGGNADADALLWAASRLYRRREPRKILVVLSDGSPTDSYQRGGYGDTTGADTGLLRVTSELAKDRMLDLYGIGINTDCVKRYYGQKARVIMDTSNLNKVLLETLEDCIVQHIGE